MSLTQSQQYNAQQVLKNIVVYVMLAPYGNEQWDLVNRINQDKKLLKLPFYKYALLHFPPYASPARAHTHTYAFYFRELLQSIVNQEVMPWQKFTAVFGEELFKAEAMTVVKADVDRKEEMHKRIVEHVCPFGSVL